MTAAGAAAPGGGPRVLIVEDEALIAILIQDTLARAGAEVVGTASSAEEALALAAEMPPGFALVDIKLKGGVDGVELARRLHERFGTEIVFLSGSKDPETRARAMAARPRGFVGKPFQPADLLRALGLPAGPPAQP
jgi:two-component system, response regulator PdtaR